MILTNSYSSALKVSVVLQAGVLIACSQTFKSYIITVFCLSFVVYWAAAVAIMLTTPRAPSRWQIGFVAMGFACICPLVWLACRPTG